MFSISTELMRHIVSELVQHQIDVLEFNEEYAYLFDKDELEEPLLKRFELLHIAFRLMGFPEENGYQFDTRIGKDHRTDYENKFEWSELYNNDLFKPTSPVHVKQSNYISWLFQHLETMKRERPILFESL